MKKRIKTALSAACLSLASLPSLVAISSIVTLAAISPHAFAEVDSPKCRQPGWFGDLGFTGYYFRYQERSSRNNSFLMRDTGNMYGYYYTLGYQFQCTDFRIALEGNRAWGNNFKYKSASTGNAKNNKFDFSEIRLLGFYPWDLNSDWTFEAYSGLGGRYLVNDGHKSYSTTGHTGYWRESRYAYVPIGARLITEFNCHKYLIAHLEYDWFLSGRQDSYIEGTIRNKQHNGYGARAGLDLQIPSCWKSFDYLLGGFIRYWSIKDSTINVSGNGRFVGIEPRNKTYEIGIKLGLVF